MRKFSCFLELAKKESQKRDERVQLRMEKEIRGWNSKTPEKWKYKTQDKAQKWRKRTAKEY